MKNKESLLISIIIANYNKASFITDTINSVLDQIFQNWELIIVDDNSTDESVQIINHFLSDKRIQFFQNSVNKGANYCRNFALKKVKGDYVIFLDADDILAVSCLENRIKKVNTKNVGNLFVFGMGVFKKKIYDDTRQWLPFSKNPLQDFLQHDLPWQTMQPLWRLDFLIELNGFDEDFERLQDVELHTRAMMHPSLQLYQFPEIIDCYYRIDEGRKNFNEFVFYYRRVSSTVKYCNKFEALVSEKLKHFLFGTLIKLYVELIYSYKTKKITWTEFQQLANMLFFTKIFMESSISKKLIFKISFICNYYFFRLPGINKILNFLVKR